MTSLNQRGIVQVLVLLILLAGIGVGVYLVQQIQIFKPKATEIKRTIKLPTGKVGMAVQGGGVFTKEKIFSALKEGGVQVYHGGWIGWAGVEKKAGVYDFSDAEPLFQTLGDDQFTFEAAIDIGGLIALDYRRLDLPPHVQFKGFDDPELKNKYLAFIGAMMDRLNSTGQKVKYILIHTEGTKFYFKEYHPDQYPKQFQAYCDLISEAMKYVKQKAPQVKVGNNGDFYDDLEIVRCVSKEADFVGLGVYPDDDRYKELQDVERVIDELVQASAPKKLVSEIGYPTSPKLGSSEQKQVEFIQLLFKALKKHKDNIEYIGYFELADQNKEVYGSAVRAQFPPDTDPQFIEKLIEFVTSLGLLREDGIAKPGWEEFRKQVKMYYESIVPPPESQTLLYLESPKESSVGQEIPVRIMGRSDTDTANLFAVKLKFPADVLEVLRIDKTGSFIQNWVEESHDNNLGTISLAGGVPAPGYKTQAGKESGLMATVIFKAKNLGSSTISFGDDSAIYRNTDNQNILQIKRDVNIVVAKGGEYCTVSFSLSNENPPPNTFIQVKVRGILDKASSGYPGGWQNVELYVDGKTGDFGWGGIENPWPTFVYNKVPTGSGGPHTLKFTTDKGKRSCTPEKTFNTQVTPTPTPTPTPPPGKKGDGNKDGKIDLVDMSILLSYFNKNGNLPPIDMDDNKKINTFDYSLHRKLLIDLKIIKGQ